MRRITKGVLLRTRWRVGLCQVIKGRPTPAHDVIRPMIPNLVESPADSRQFLGDAVLHLDSPSALQAD